MDTTQVTDGRDPFPERSVNEAHRAKMESKRERRSLEAMIASVQDLDREGHDWRLILNRSDLPTDLLETPIAILHGEAKWVYGVRYGAHQDRWQSAVLSLGAFLALLSFRDTQALKDERAISLMSLKPGLVARQKQNAASVTGIAFDDDNHIDLGRDVLERSGGPLRCSFGTASDGKDADRFPVESYATWKAEVGAAGLAEASDDVVAAFLNHNKSGQPYRNVSAVRTSSGLPKVAMIDGKYHAHFTMEPQTRTRTVVPFQDPIAGALLDEIVSRGLMKKVCDAIEKDIFGVIGHDEKTKTVNAVAYLPSGNRGEHYFKVCGDAYLYDAVDTARRVLAENPPPPKRSNDRTGKVRDSGGLRGLLFATMIEERFPELQLGTKSQPLVLRRCPFADGHGSRRGQADGSAFVYDADPDRSGYPFVGCHHDSCRNRATKDFVNEMIQSGELPADIYDDQDYRIELE